MHTANISFEDLAAVGVTVGPGLGQCLRHGIARAQHIAATYRLPLVRVNHLEAHVLSAHLTPNTKLEYPFLAVLVSGGHTQFAVCRGVGDFLFLG